MWVVGLMSQLLGFAGETTHALQMLAAVFVRSPACVQLGAVTDTSE
jgi:hypothetical protein